VFLWREISPIEYVVKAGNAMRSWFRFADVQVADSSNEVGCSLGGMPE
jgi:hypothetical protein